MSGPPALVLLLTLLTLCIMAGTPDLWVRVHREANTFTVRCCFLGSGSISLATVSCGGPEGAGGTMLAVLHPKSGVKNWAPDCQAHWESRGCVSLTLEQCAGSSPRPNTTFCCKFASFPEGSQEACGNLLLSTSDQGHPSSTGASLLRADLAGILGASGVLLLGCVYLLHLLRRQGQWSLLEPQPPASGPQTQLPVQASPASLASLHTYAAVGNSYYCPAPQDTCPAPTQTPWTLLPTHPPCQPPGAWATLVGPRRCSFVSVENRLYVHSGPGTLERRGV